MRVCHILTNPYSYDNRVRKECEHLVSMGFDVHVVALKSDATHKAFEVINGVKVHRTDGRSPLLATLGRLLVRIPLALSGRSDWVGRSVGNVIRVVRVNFVQESSFRGKVSKLMRMIRLVYPKNLIQRKSAHSEDELEEALREEVAFTPGQKLKVVVLLSAGVFLAPFLFIGFLASKTLFFVFGKLNRSLKPLARLIGRKFNNFIPQYVRRLNYLEKALYLQADVYQANDWDTLGVTYLSSKIVGSNFVYDSHELYDESFPNRKSLLQRAYIRALEQFYARRAAEVVTVSNEIARVLKQRYGLRNAPIVVRNIQPLVKFEKSDDDHSFHDLIGVENEMRIVVYAGLITNGRGLEELLRAATLMDESAVVVIMGPSRGYDEHLKRIASEMGVLNKKVYILDPVPPDKLPCLLQDAYVGVITTPTSVLSYYYGLSNKMFSYVQSGVPIISIDHPEKASFIRTFDVGLLIQDNRPECIADAVNYLISSPWERDRLSKNCLEAAANEINWQKEVQKYERVYVRMYERLLFGKPLTQTDQPIGEAAC